MLQPDLPTIEFGASWYEESTAIDFSSSLYADRLVSEIPFDAYISGVTNWNLWPESKVLTVA